MTGEHRVGPEDWSRLEALWESARELPADERDRFLATHGVDGALRDELESLLTRASAAEAFFDRFLTAVPRTDLARLRDSDIPSDTPSAADADPMLGETIEHYQIVARLGDGGMGIVYRAVDVRLRRTVALKLLGTGRHRDARAKERLLGEARAAAALDHANICTIYEVGETAERQPFIAMAFYAGETLEQVLRRGPLPMSTALDYAAQIARGLGAAHERGVIHRDVKPANIIVTDGGVLKLLDFGIARMVDVVVSHESLTAGTIAYMSPEQVAIRPLDHRTDLWSLGVVLYEMCTGQRPFTGDNPDAILRAILHSAPAPASRLRGDVPPHVESILQRLLAKDSAHRYRNSDQLLSDLASPAKERPKGLGKRRWRHAPWYLTAALALGALILSWRASPSPASSDRRIAAEDLYNQGNRDALFRSESGRQQALHFFEQAIAVDSTYAPAHAALTHLLIMTREDKGGARGELLARAAQAAEASIRVDSLLADAHAALGHVLLVNYQFAQAEAQFKRAVELDAKQPYVREFLVWLYVFMERPRDALEHAQRAAAENANSPAAITEVARALLVNGRCDEALELLGRLTYLRPPPARAADIAAQCYGRREMWQQAIDELRPVAERNPLQQEPWLAFMLARGGQTAEALQIRDRLLDRWRSGGSGAYGLAVTYAGLRELDSAFVWLDKAIDDRSLRHTVMEPAFEELRRDPRFDRLRKKLGMPQR